MTNQPERVLKFDRCFNFRDLGGYAGLDGRPVRWRRVFRSMTPQHMSQADALAVAPLDIALVFDFRGDQHVSSGPVPRAGGRRFPLGPQRTGANLAQFRDLPPAQALPRVLDVYGRQYATALTAMAEQPSANVLFHCRLGKDRTGVFAALLLKLLGVSDDDVIEDYMLTDRYEGHVRHLLVEYEGAVLDEGARVAREPADRAAMANVLRRLVGEYGGAYGYFAHHGVPSSRLADFVEAFLEPPAINATASRLQDEAAGS